MRILFLATWFPYPPDNGSRIRTYYLLKSLAKRHDVYLVSLFQEDSDPANIEHLRDICTVVSVHPSRWFKPGTLKSALGFFSRRPRSMVDTYDPAVKSAVEKAIKEVNPDVLIASTLGMVEYVPNGMEIPSVLEEHNCEFAVLERNAKSYGSAFKRLRYDIGWRKFARWEADICRSFSKVVMVSEGDRDLMLRAAPDLVNMEVVPNGVDTDHYDPAQRRPEPSTLIYNGAVTYGANLDAVRHYAADIYPLLRDRIDGIKLRVTGRSKGVDLTGIADCSGIEFTGYVNDIRDVLATCSICIVPLRQGGGSRLKILEAMAAGVPVVSTRVGAEGVEAADGEHLLIADTPGDFADCVSQLLSDHTLASSITSSARKLVEDKYSWTALGDRFVDIVESAHISC